MLRVAIALVYLIGGGTVRYCAHWLNWKCGIALGPDRELAYYQDEAPVAPQNPTVRTAPAG